MDVSRRQFFLTTIGVALGAGVLSACKSTPAGLACDDVSSLAPADLTMRQALGYEDKTATPEKRCSGCALFVPASPDANAACGTCKIVKGPINPGGNCKSWAAKPA